MDPPHPLTQGRAKLKLTGPWRNASVSFNLFPSIITINKLHFLTLMVIIFIFLSVGFLTISSLSLESSQNKLEAYFNKLCKKLKQKPKKGEGPLAFKERLEKGGVLNEQTVSLIDFYISAKYSPSSVNHADIKIFINKINNLRI